MVVDGYEEDLPADAPGSLAVVLVDAVSDSTDFPQSFRVDVLGAVPEPTTASLLALGIVGLTLAGRRRP